MWSCCCFISVQSSAPAYCLLHIHPLLSTTEAPGPLLQQMKILLLIQINTFCTLIEKISDTSASYEKKINQRRDFCINILFKDMTQILILIQWENGYLSQLLGSGNSPRWWWRIKLFAIFFSIPIFSFSQPQKAFLCWTMGLFAPSVPSCSWQILRLSDEETQTFFVYRAKEVHHFKCYVSLSSASCQKGQLKLRVCCFVVYLVVEKVVELVLHDAGVRAHNVGCVRVKIPADTDMTSALNRNFSSCCVHSSAPTLLSPPASGLWCCPHIQRLCRQHCCSRTWWCLWF